MKKKIIILVLVITALFSMSFNAYAVQLSEIEYVQKVVDKANDKIDILVIEAQQEALINPDMENEIIFKLAHKTSEIAEKAIDIGNDYNITVTCNYITVTIGTQNVLIDPLVVGGW